MPTPTVRSTRAHEAYLDWREADLKERAAVIGRVADLFRQNADELARLMTLEMGKPVTQAKGEVELSAAIFEYYATKGPDLLADEILDIAGAGKAVVRTAPIGAAARDHALELPLLPGRAVRGTEPAAGQHHSAQTCRATARSRRCGWPSCWTRRAPRMGSTRTCSPPPIRSRR